MRFHVHQAPGSRDGRMIRHAFVQRDPHERSNRQTVTGAPGDSALRIDPFEIAPPSAGENRSPVTNPVGPLRRHRNPHKSSRRAHRTSSHPESDSAVGKTDGLIPLAAPQSASTTAPAGPASFVVPSPCLEDDQITTEVTQAIDFHHTLLAPGPTGSR